MWWDWKLNWQRTSLQWKSWISWRLTVWAIDKINSVSKKTESSISETSEKVEATLSPEERLNSILKKYPFIRIGQKEWKRFIYTDFSQVEKMNLDWKDVSYNLLLINFLKDLSSSNFYIKWIFEKIDELNKICLFSLEKTKRIFLWEWFWKVENFDNFQNIRIENNYEKATYEFAFKEKIINLDIFMAYLYKNWIFYWFDKEWIEKWLKYEEEWKRVLSEFVIARQKNAVDWKNAELEKISLKTKKNLKPAWSERENISWWNNIDLYTYVNSTFDVKEWEKLFKKIPALKWENGRNIKWQIIKAIPWIDEINLKSMIWEWLKIIEEDWFFYIVSEIDWKFTEELINGKLKMKVTDKIVITWNVDTKNIWNKVYTKWDIVHIKKRTTGFTKEEQQDKAKWIFTDWSILEWRIISWTPDKIIIEWDLLWIIDVWWNTEIHIEWNIWWKWRLFHKWIWKIFVWWVISNNAIIDAKNSVVELNNLDLGTIYAEVAQINKVSRWSIIANKVEINEIKTRFNNSSISIIWENIDIKEFVNSPSLKISVITKWDIFKQSVESLENKKIKFWWEIDKILDNPPFKDFKFKFLWIDYTKEEFDKIYELLLEGKEVILLLMSKEKKLLEKGKELPEKQKNILDNYLKKMWPYLSRLEQKSKLSIRTKSSISKMKDIYNKQLKPLLDKIDLINIALLKSEKKNNSSVKIWFTQNSKINNINLVKFQNPWKKWDMFEDINDKTLLWLLDFSNSALSRETEKIPVIFWNWTFYWNEKFDWNFENDSYDFN